MASVTEKLANALNAKRGKRYPDVGYLMFADIRGDGSNRRSLYIIINEKGGVSHSSLNAATPRERCAKLREAIAAES